MFSDTLIGGDGNDDLWGDFLITNTRIGGGELDLDLVVLTLTDANTLFDDTLDGGLGDDSYWGQLGDDLLIGADGADTFFFGTALEDNSSGVGLGDIFDGNDTINGFDFTNDNDMVDLDALFDILGSFSDDDDRAEGVKIEQSGGDSILTVQKSDDSTLVANFSITFDGVLLTEGAFGTFSEQNLLDIGIIVSDA